MSTGNMDANQLRFAVLDDINRALSHPILLGEDTTRRLMALRSLIQKDDCQSADSVILKLIPYLSMKEQGMGIFLKLLSIWSAIQPFITSTNWQAVIDAFHKAMQDFTGGNYAQVVTDLLAALKTIIPSAPPGLLDAHAP